MFSPSQFLITWMNHHLKGANKDVEMSRSWRECGNQQFAMKEFTSCIETYTKSIVCCPEEFQEEMSLAVANRSAALFHLGLFEECLADINAALERNYPKRLFPKILSRKAKCLKILQNSVSYPDEVKSLEKMIKDLKIADQSK